MFAKWTAKRLVSVRKMFMLSKPTSHLLTLARIGFISRALSNRPTHAGINCVGGSDCPSAQTGDNDAWGAKPIANPLTTAQIMLLMYKLFAIQSTAAGIRFVFDCELTHICLENIYFWETGCLSARVGQNSVCCFKSF